MIPVWSLIRQSCMSILTVNITFAPIATYVTLLNLLSLFVFDFEQLELMTMGIYNYSQTW